MICVIWFSDISATQKPVVVEYLYTLLSTASLIDIRFSFLVLTLLLKLEAPWNLRLE